MYVKIIQKRIRRQEIAMKKRLLAILIAGLSVISMTACGNAGDSVPTNNNTQAADDGASAQHTIAVVLKTLKATPHKGKNVI